MCASNLRQVALALATYESTYKVFPKSYDWDYGRYEPANVPKSWVDMIVELGFLKGPDLARGQYGVLACPAVEDSQPLLDRPGLCGPHYGYNDYVNPPNVRPTDSWYGPRSFWGKRALMTRNAEEKILLAEVWSWESWSDGRTTREWRATYGYWVTAPHIGNVLTGSKIDFRHARGRAANVLYLAGNVQLVYATTAHLREDEDVPSHPFSTYHFVRDQ
jgi:hypothetical protein